MFFYSQMSYLRYYNLFKFVGAPKIQVSRTMMHLQHITDSGQEVVPEVNVKPNYALESQPMEWTKDSDVTEHYKFISEICKYVFLSCVKYLREE